MPVLYSQNQCIKSTEARNHFPEINKRVQKKGFCVITKHGDPTLVVLPFHTFEQMQSRLQKKETSHFDWSALDNASRADHSSEDPVFLAHHAWDDTH